MRFDTKIAVVVSDDLAPWQKLNVACFLAGGLVGAHPELAGEPYQDASARLYGPLIRQPVLVFAAAPGEIKAVLGRATERGIPVSIYTRELFATGNDVDNRAAVRAVPTDQLDLVGLALHAPRRDVDKVTEGLKLHA
jgi:hypothetical protein